MGQMNGNELRSVLIEKNLIDEAGTVNVFKVNITSGAHTWPLLSEVWNLYQNDVTPMEELQVFLNAVYEQGQYDILMGILKVLYNCCWLLIPDDLQMIFDCEEKELKEIYLYEFLEDFQDIMLYEAGVDIKSAQRFLGHADIEMTLAVYTHLSKYKEAEAISSLNAHLDKITSFEPVISQEQPKQKTKKRDELER